MVDDASNVGLCCMVICVGVVVADTGVNDLRLHRFQKMVNCIMVNGTTIVNGEYNGVWYNGEW